MDSNSFIEGKVQEAMKFTGTDNLDDCLQKLKEIEKSNLKKNQRT